MALLKSKKKKPVFDSMSPAPEPTPEDLENQIPVPLEEPNKTAEVVKPEVVQNPTLMAELEKVKAQLEELKLQKPKEVEEEVVVPEEKEEVVVEDKKEDVETEEEQEPTITLPQIVDLILERVENLQEETIFLKRQLKQLKSFMYGGSK